MGKFRQVIFAVQLSSIGRGFVSSIGYGAVLVKTTDAVVEPCIIMGVGLVLLGIFIAAFSQVKCKLEELSCNTNEEAELATAHCKDTASRPRQSWLKTTCFGRSKTG